MIDSKISDLKHQLASEREHGRLLQGQLDAILQPTNAQAGNYDPNETAEQLAERLKRIEIFVKAVNAVPLRMDVRALVDAVVTMLEAHTDTMVNWPEWDAVSLALHKLPESHVKLVAKRR